ncbi:hypothetical protein HPS56_01890 [Prevotella sp. PMUR]|uniref:Uncharacterized protein n=2 Tax=Xylanibacter muris TaxID=2736290 RepID=A0ABX2ALP5_9BACT|nr:hypothetical protein [Xylanibacter muris]
MFVFKIFKAMRILYGKVIGYEKPSPVIMEKDRNKVSRLIYDMLSADGPCMIARFGANEMGCVLNYLDVKRGMPPLLDYIRGKSGDWWWSEGKKACMYNQAGFFPVDDESLSRFSEMMLDDARMMSLCGVLTCEIYDLPKLYAYMDDPEFVPVGFLDPFVANVPWSRVLENKRVVVVHPFAELIESQYANRRNLFSDSRVLPDFTLRTVKAVQSIGGGDAIRFDNWFEALDYMKSEIDKLDYDICLLGCGAYGFPLAAHVCRTGRKAVHIGGSLQLLFGIKGKRWENPSEAVQFGLPSDFYIKLMDNPYWVRPTKYRTDKSDKVEGGCYW